MEQNTEEVLKSIIKNSCIGLREIANTDKSLSLLQKNHILWSISKVEQAVDVNLKKAITKLNILTHGVHDIVQQPSVACIS